jgi:sugar (pentulose or hexulose) kinase
LVDLGIDIGASGVKAALVNEAGSHIRATPGSELLTLRGEVIERPSPVPFLPYLDGERAPHNDATAAGAFVGLRSATGRDDIVQSVVEGVAFAVGDNLAALGGSMLRSRRSISWVADRARRSGRRSSSTCPAFRSPSLSTANRSRMCKIAQYNPSTILLPFDG